MIQLTPKPLFYGLIPIVCLTLIMACQKRDVREFSIPEGPATDTLKTFATQAGIEILFDPQEVGYSRTKPVSGRFTAEQTLELMLKDTTLAFSIDARSHAYAVVSTDPPDNSKNLR